MKVITLAEANEIAAAQPDTHHAPNFWMRDSDGLVFLCDVNEIVTQTHISNCDDIDYLYGLLEPYHHLFEDRGYSISDWLEVLAKQMLRVAISLNLQDWVLTKEADSLNQGVMVGVFERDSVSGPTISWPSYEWQTYFTNSNGEVTSYGRRMAMEKSSGRFMPVRDLERNIGARYTKCVMCQCFNKVRTHMVPIRHAKPRARKAWNNRKNVCISCIKYVVRENLASQDRPSIRMWEGSVGFDGVDQLFYNPSREDWRFNDTWGHDVFENANAEYKRFFGKLDIETIMRFRIIERIDIPRWNFRFDTTMHNWNYRFPVRLVNVNTDGTKESDSPGKDYMDVQWFYSSGPFYGMEFECFVRNDRTDYRDSNIVMQDAVRMFHDTDYPSGFEMYDGQHQLMYRKSDGSLRDGVGVEFVSQPLSYDYWMTQVPQRFWDYFQNNFRARNSSECGIHIHIGWDSMQVAERYVFLKILNELNSKRSPLLAAIAGRDSTYYATWNTLFYQGSADTAFMVAMEKRQTDQSSTPKYNAINTLHDSTIELRYFQGNTGRKSILGIVQFVDFIYRHAVDVIHSDFHKEGTAWNYLTDGPRTFLRNELEKINNDVDEYLINVLSRYPSERLVYLQHRLDMADYEMPFHIET